MKNSLEKEIEGDSKELNFGEKNARRMMQFASDFQYFEIVVPLSRQLSWSHFLISQIVSPLATQFKQTKN